MLTWYGQMNYNLVKNADLWEPYEQKYLLECIYIAKIKFYYALVKASKSEMLNQCK